ncbi:hypothetical protein GALMADRAFT_75730 [Galerina marginata CBS 339.88]|uniref:Peroxidase n=1 Tax=Galerina marginata (strain CBS 339.88) TaxID=685588 RepID=A0A067SIN9_GALM3|nr:hypothetical protein GALMADRAFT_75730 [Galerina marginata CBS 339.88]
MAFARLNLFVSFALALSQVANAGLVKRVTCSTGHVTANAACCALFPIVDTLQAGLFDGAECGEEAHSALRIAFHDAIGFSLKGTAMLGGADGSILVFNKTETSFHANGGIDDIVDSQFPFFQQTGLSAGDFIHLAAAVGTANCPGAPRLKFFLGRPPPKAAAPDLTVPEPTDSVTAILARFADAGFSPREVVALLSSHTIAAADVVDVTIPGTPFDSTPHHFDGNFFLEVLLKGRLFPGAGPQTGEVLSPIAGEMRLQSDFAISQDSRTACFWQDMINDQTRIMTEFGAAMAKLQVLGQNTKNLIDCSDVVPVPVAMDGTVKIPASFTSKDIQVACAAQPFPKLATRTGPAPTVPPM